MNLKKNIDTNLGITILLMFSALLVLADFIYIGNELGNDLGFKKKSNTTSFVIETEDNTLTEDRILLMGNEMYDRVSRLLFHPEFGVLTDDDGDVKFIKSESGEFVQTSEWQQGIYFKVVSGIEEYQNVLADDLFNRTFASYNGEFYSDVTPSGGRGGNIYYIETVLSLVSSSDSEIVYSADSYYYTDNDDMLNGMPKSDSNSEVKKNVFKLVKENDNWKVSEFTLAY